MLEAARQLAPGITFEGWTSQAGPPSIEGPADGDAATPPLLELVQRAGAQGADGIIIGCFDDTGLAEAARLVPCPVIGIGQAAFHYAALRQWRFSVVTTLAISVPIIEDNIATYGLDRHLRRVRASEVPVLALEHDPDAAAHHILAEAKRAIDEDGIDGIVLGCAGMVRITALLRARLSCQVIDPVEAAIKCLLWLQDETAQTAP